MPVRITSELQIKVAGTELPADIHDLLISAVVDESVGMADVFLLSFRDPDSSVLDKAGFRLGAPVTVGVTTMEASAAEVIMDGEVTAIEAEFGKDGSTTIVRGLDRAHRLFRGRKNRTFKNVKASDVARTVIGNNGLAAKVDQTKTVFAQVAQVGESDWQFLKRLAFSAGWEVSVEATTCHFRDPSKPSGATPLRLVMGENLVNFRASISTAEQVGRVEARSFDSLLEKAMVAQPPVRGGARTGTALSKVIGAFPTRPYVASTSFRIQAETTSLATALAGDIAEHHAELHGEVGGDPKLRAGTEIDLVDVGPAFSGTYRATAVRHRFDGTSGYTSEFSVAGRRENSLLGLTSGGAGRATTMPGLMVGVVTNSQDPLKLGRVKIKLPTLGDDFESDWAQVAFPGAGDPREPRGLFLVPEVGDVVLVGFELGDIDRPFVLGGLYTNKQKPILGDAVAGSGHVEKRSFTSRSGNVMRFEDKAGAEQIIVANKAETVMIKLVTANGKHLVQIKCDKDVEVTATGNTKVDVTGNIDVKSMGNTKVAATGNLEMSGAMVKITAMGVMELKGAVIKLN